MSVICTICGYKCNIFLPKYGRLSVNCPNCGSFERHRHQIVVFNKFIRGKLSKNPTILHIAPENCIRESIKNLGTYITIDLNMNKIDIKASLTDLPLLNSSIDLIWCSHVLEHIKEVNKAIGELYRVMNGNGILLVDVPILRRNTKKLENAIEHGHYWIPGNDWFDKYKNIGFNVEVHGIEICEIQKYSILPESKIALCTKRSSIISLKCELN